MDLHSFQLVVATSLRDLGALPIPHRDGLPNFEALPRGAALPLQSLLLLDKWQVRFVPSVLHLVDVNEVEGGGINDVSLACGRLRVGKDMAQAGITSLGAHLGALHLICVVGHLDEEIFRNGFCERGQADVAVELVD
jgi:hypothetical protein